MTGKGQSTPKRAKGGRGGRGVDGGGGSKGVGGQGMAMGAKVTVDWENAE